MCSSLWLKLKDFHGLFGTVHTVWLPLWIYCTLHGQNNVWISQQTCTYKKKGKVLSNSVWACLIWGLIVHLFYLAVMRRYVWLLAYKFVLATMQWSAVKLFFPSIFSCLYRTVDHSFSLLHFHIELKIEASSQWFFKTPTELTQKWSMQELSPAVSPLLLPVCQCSVVQKNVLSVNVFNFINLFWLKTPIS